jgi:hypothetical protein
MAMNEEELAQWFEKRRGDTSLWSEAPVKANVGRGGSVVFSVRFSPDELVLLRRRAQEWGTTISDLIRSGALQAAERASRVSTLMVDRILAAPPAAAAVRMTYDAVLAGCATPLAAEPSEETSRSYVLGLRGGPRSSAGPIPVGV